ncbi:MAG: hypothetical protein EHM35_15205 [Planctomycetaceae bacterium]|nr:MAG: hypothetical protein EHM35_15205 [Planctomycetaceae bacterium]
METVDANNCTPKSGDRKPLRFSYFRAYQSMKNAMLDVQSELNRMPLHQLGAMLARCARMARSQDHKEREVARTLEQQVLLAMDPVNDADRADRAVQ